MQNPVSGSLRRILIAIVVSLFFLSGASALIYEVAWTRMFSVVAGGTTRALTAVLASYMAGLALGAFLGGRYVDRKPTRPILLYGLLEGSIGISAIIISFAIPWLLPVLKVGKAVLGPYPLLFDTYRFLVSGSLLLLPTTLMGATFPVLLRGVLSNHKQFGFTAGFLYAANTLGAVTGSLVSGFLLVPVFGLRATTWIAAIVNVLIMLFVASLPWLRRVIVVSKESAEWGKIEDSHRTWLFWVLLSGYALSGLCAMVYQVGWARALALSLGNSTYALGLIFAAFIGGLALGGVFITPFVDRVRMPLLWAAGLEVVIGLSAVAVMPLFEWVTARMFNWSLDFQNQFGVFQLVRFMAAFGLILFPTLAMGALFPVVVKIAGLWRKGVGEPAGKIYAANTLGAIFGTFLASHILIRFLQVQNTLLTATCLSVLVGIVWLLFSPIKLRVILAAGGAVTGVTVAALIVLPRWDPLLMDSGPYLYAHTVEEELRAGKDIRDILHTYFDVLYYKEGVETTVSVEELRASGELYLRINGKTDASSKGDMHTQVLSAHIPILLHPSPKKVMILGLASGVSAGSALLHPVERVDCLEISPAVVRASEFFKPVSHLDYLEPRFHLIVDDARNYLALSDVRYDVIILAPTNPWVAGMSMLYTREFYHLINDQLEDGGLALIFIPVYNLDPDTLRMLLRSITDSFDYVTLWESNPLVDYFAIASKQPISVDLGEFMARASESRILSDLERVKVHGAEELFARFVMGPTTLTSVEGKGPLHTDDRRQLEFILPKLHTQPITKRMYHIIQQVLSVHEPAKGVLRNTDEATLDLFSRFNMSRRLYYQAYSISYGQDIQPSQLDSFIQAWRKALRSCEGRYPSEFASKQLAIFLSARAEARLKTGNPSGAVADWEESFELDQDKAIAADYLISFYFQKGNDALVKVWGEKALSRYPKDAYALVVLGDLAMREQKLAEAEHYFRTGIMSTPRDPVFHWKLGMVLALQGRYSEAEAKLKKLISEFPSLADPKIVLADVLLNQGRNNEAEKYLKAARKIAPQHPMLKQLEKMLPD